MGCSEPAYPTARMIGGNAGYVFYANGLRVGWRLCPVVLSRRLSWVIGAIFSFSLVSFSYSVSNGNTDIFTDGLNNPYLIASTLQSGYNIDRESEDIPVVVEMEGDPCDQVTCMDIYPEDGKIDGKTVSQMTASGINNIGQVVGRCTLEDSSDPFAFVREPDGKVWIFKTPSSSGQGEFTDISDSGDAVGFYENDSLRTKIGFLMNSNHQWVSNIEYPENPCPEGKAYLHTQPNGINVKGEIVGNYGCTERAEEKSETLFNGDGFYRSPDGSYYRVQYEDAVRTVAGKISDTGVIVGYYVLENNAWIPFAAMKEDVIRPIGATESSVRQK